MTHNPLYAPPIPPEQRFRETAPERAPFFRFAPWESPPPGFIPFVSQERASMTGNGAVVVTQRLAYLETPDGMRGVIRELIYRINDVALTTNVTFNLRFDQGQVQSTRVEVFPKVASTDLIEFDPSVTVLKVPSGSAMDVLVSIAAGDIGTYLVGTLFRGWWYPEDFDRQWSQRINA